MNPEENSFRMLKESQNRGKPEKRSGEKEKKLIG